MLNQRPFSYQQSREGPSKWRSHHRGMGDTAPTAADYAGGYPGLSYMDLPPPNLTLTPSGDLQPSLNLQAYTPGVSTVVGGGVQAGSGFNVSISTLILGGVITLAAVWAISENW